MELKTKLSAALLLLLPASASANRAAADAFLTSSRVQNIINRMETTRLNGGRGAYIQARKSHSVPPADGASVPPDRLNDKTSDEGMSWDDIMPGLPAAWPVSLEMNSYSTRCGRGYILVARVREGEETYARTVHVFGCDHVDRAFPWRLERATERSRLNDLEPRTR